MGHINFAWVPLGSYLEYHKNEIRLLYLLLNFIYTSFCSLFMKFYSKSSKLKEKL